MMNAERGMMNERRLLFSSSFIIQRSSFSYDRSRELKLPEKSENVIRQRLRGLLM
jgi:hypothetical protein